MFAIKTVGDIDFGFFQGHNAKVDWFYKAFGAKLKIARKSAGLTQEELGARVGLSRVSVTNIERGAQHFPAHMLIALAKAVGVDPTSLLPNETAIGIVPQELLSNVSAVEQEWINKIVRSDANEPKKGKNAKTHRGGKEVTR
jgi:transcriptional regulator with XRE-family HTH domain